MRLFDILSEMAFPRNKAEERITELGDQIVKYLFKIVKWNDSQHYNKHLVDLQGWLISVSNITIKGNKRPSVTDYKQWLFNDNGINLKQIKKLSVLYGSLPEKVDDTTAIITINNIADKICADLANDSFVDITNYLQFLIDENK